MCGRHSTWAVITCGGWGRGQILRSGDGKPRLSDRIPRKSVQPGAVVETPMGLQTWSGVGWNSYLGLEGKAEMSLSVCGRRSGSQSGGRMGTWERWEGIESGEEGGQRIVSGGRVDGWGFRVRREWGVRNGGRMGGCGVGSGGSMGNWGWGGHGVRNRGKMRSQVWREDGESGVGGGWRVGSGGRMGRQKLGEDRE